MTTLLVIHHLVLIVSHVISCVTPVHVASLSVVVRSAATYWQWSCGRIVVEL